MLTFGFMNTQHSIQSIYIYPIKGLRGISLSQSQLLERGLAHDRRYVLVDKEGMFLSQRKFPHMALFTCAMNETEITVSYHNESISWSIDSFSDKKRCVSIWDLDTYAFEVEDRINHWFTVQIGVDCALVKMTDRYDRIKPLKDDRHTKVSFADGYPVLVLGTASLEFLNQKLSDKIEESRFRANIYIHTTVPHIEDTWSKLIIGGATLEVIKPCARCQVVNIDQLSAEVNHEPLKTLAMYRKVGNKVNFGVNAICVESGLLSIDDLVIVLA